MAAKNLADLANKFPTNGVDVPAFQSLWGKMSTKAKKLFSRGAKNPSGVRSSSLPFKAGDLTDSQLNDIADMLAKRQDDFAADAGDLADDAAGARKADGGTNETGNVGNTAENIAERESIVMRRLGSAFSSTKTYLGLGITGMLLYSGIVIDNTDGQTVDIKKLVIDEDDNKYAVIDYSAGNSLFQPAERDTITLSGTGLESANDCIITEVIGKRKIKVDISNIPSASRPARGTIVIDNSARTGSPSGVSGTPEFTCNSDFGNQFGEALNDLLGSVGSAAASSLGIVINQAGQIIQTAASAAGAAAAAAAAAAATAAAAAARGAGDVANEGFCALIPFLCDSSIWIMIGIGIVALIILYVLVSSYSKKS